MGIDLLEKRSGYSQNRLFTLREEVWKIQELHEVPGLSIYVTGSYGRFEASERSDLDLFFVHNDFDEEREINKLTKTLIDAELIKIIRRMGFPEFSNEGEYLEVHSLKDMLQYLGGRHDDYKNYFTARILLLLESRPIYNDQAYNVMIRKIVDAYFRDYHDHEKNFRPFFLVNDILRFWKTLCLNYEKKRNIPSEDPQQKNKDHLRNLKLKFSRLLTCFSTVIPLCPSPHTTPKEIISLIERPPLDRLKTVISIESQNQVLFDEIVEDYAWFLNITAKEDILEWIGIKRNRSKAFSRARQFGMRLYTLLELTSRGTDSMRYLVM